MWKGLSPQAQTPANGRHRYQDAVRTHHPLTIQAISTGEGAGSCSKHICRISSQYRTSWPKKVGRVRFHMCGSPLLHRALTSYVGSGELEPHFETLRGIYRPKCEALVDSLC